MSNDQLDMIFELLWTFAPLGLGLMLAWGIFNMIVRTFYEIDLPDPANRVAEDRAAPRHEKATGERVSPPPVPSKDRLAQCGHCGQVSKGFGACPHCGAPRI